MDEGGGDERRESESNRRKSREGCGRDGEWKKFGEEKRNGLWCKMKNGEMGCDKSGKVV